MTEHRPRATGLVVRLSNWYRRFLAVFLGIIGPEAAYALVGRLARWMYHLFDPLRLRSEAQCRAALGPGFDAAKIAEQAFVHRAWNLVDLMLAPRFIRRSTYACLGGRIPEPYLGLLHAARDQRRPVIMVTCYYGPFDLLPLFLGYNGVRAGVVYRHHPNPDFDAFRRSVRAASGCEMVPLGEAIVRLPQILDAGGTVAILSDHHARRGIPVTFLGLPTKATRSVALLAEHYQAVVVVAGIRRRASLCCELVVADLFDESAWREQEDPITYITRRTVAALERIVLAEPSQYLWAQARWGLDLPADSDQAASAAPPGD